MTKYKMKKTKSIRINAIEFAMNVKLIHKRLGIKPKRSKKGRREFRKEHHRNRSVIFHSKVFSNIFYFFELELYQNVTKL